MPLVTNLRAVPLVIVAVPIYLLYQAAGIAGASYALWFWLVSQYSASRLSAFSVLTPICGVAAGALLLDEPLGPFFGVAVGFVVLGLWLVNRPAR